MVLIDAYTNLNESFGIFCRWRLITNGTENYFVYLFVSIGNPSNEAH